MVGSVLYLQTLHLTEKPFRNKHASLFGPFVSDEENKVLNMAQMILNNVIAILM
jgi:hypothetical protein